MVGRHHHEGFPVGIGKLQGLRYGEVEAQLLDHRGREAVGVAGIVDLCPLHHEEEALLGFLRQLGNGCLGDIRQEIKRFLGRISAHPVIQADHLSGGLVHRQGVLRVGVAIGLHPGEEVDAVGPAPFHVVGAAPADEVHVAGKPVAGDAFRAVPFGGMAVEDGRRRIGDVPEGDHARRLPEGLEIVRKRGILHRTVMVGSDVAGPGQVTGRQGAAARSGIPDEVILRVVELDANALHLEEAEVAVVGIGPGRDLVQAHAVADEENDVLDLLVGAVVPVGRRVRGDAAGELQLLVLEAGEIPRGGVQLLGAGDARLHLVAAQDEVLVAPVVKEEVRDRGLVGVDDIDPQLPQGEIGGGAFRRLPEADGLPGGMDRGDGLLHGVQFRVDHPALAVPLAGEVLEAAADHRDLIQLRGGIMDLAIRTDFPVEPDAGRIVGIVFRVRPVAGNHDLHAVLAVEDIRIGLHQLDHPRKGVDALEVHEEHQLLITVLPHPAAVFAEAADDGLDIHLLQTAGRRQVLPVVRDEDLAVMQEDICLDGAAVLRIGLPEGNRPVVIVVGMKQDRPLLGAERQREKQGGNNQEAFHIQ